MDLSLVPIPDLVKELRRRSIHFVFGHVVHDEDTPSHTSYFFDWNGCIFTCRGLAESIADDVGRKIAEIEAQSYPQGEGG